MHTYFGKITVFVLLLLLVTPLLSEGADDQSEHMPSRAFSLLRTSESVEAAAAVKGAYWLSGKRVWSQLYVDIDLAKSFEMMAEVYGVLAQYIEGKSLFLVTLEMSKKMLGPIHPSVVESLDNLGRLYINRRDPPYTDSFFQRGVLIREGAEVDVETLARTGSLKDLATSYHSFGQYAQTESSVPRSAVLRNDANRTMLESLYEDMARFRYEKLPVK